MKVAQRSELIEDAGNPLRQVDPQELIGPQALDHAPVWRDLAVGGVGVIEPGLEASGGRLDVAVAGGVGGQ
jgi:hypothetical protein